MGFGDFVALTKLFNGTVLSLTGSSAGGTLGKFGGPSVSDFFGLEKILLLFTIGSIEASQSISIDVDVSIDGTNFTSGGFLGSKAAIVANGTYGITVINIPVSALAISISGTQAFSSCTILGQLSGAQT
jgi:hypothetical protein